MARRTCSIPLLMSIALDQATSELRPSDDFNTLPVRQHTCDSLVGSFEAVRAATDRFSLRFSAEDQNLQSMPNASPLKWHRAHTSWFFETFLLKPFAKDYRSPDETYEYLFNSYYNGIGKQYPRAQRGLISRPDTEAINRYRAHVDQSMKALISRADPKLLSELMPLILLGLNHEQQHQELMVTDLKHGLSFNPAHPAWAEPLQASAAATELLWTEFEGGLKTLGHEGQSFHFDNETPRHPVMLQPFALANRPATCGDYLAFIDDGGYQRPELWLSDGWAWRRDQRIEAPLYWWDENGQWMHYTAHGADAIDPLQPVSHVSFYEAWAFANWSGARLPTEAEWEHAASGIDPQGHFADSGHFHPAGVGNATRMVQLFGDVWEWTASSYAPYPGFRPASGEVGEYNGKFMANQMVLRGGSCATPAGHVRTTYRNFFYPADRWQFSGLRLARDLP